MKKYILSILAIILSLQICYGQKIDKMKPPFWWKGMNNPQLQIMFHGPDIADYEVKINTPGVVLSKTIRTINPNYLFVYLSIPAELTANQISIQFLKDATLIDEVFYELKTREQNSAHRDGFDNSDVIYLITPDRFANGNPSNDHFEELGDHLDRNNNQARHGGDIEGIINHLDYIKDMGFTAIWINPLVINQMPRTSYHGYAMTDHYRIDPRFGTMDEYLQLSKLAREKGIKIIMDQVLNHIGLEHWWMKDLPDTNWINSKEKYAITNHRRTVESDPYAAPSDVQKFERGWFVDQMPDLNGEHPLLRDYMVQNSIWWIEEAGLSGIRHDTHPYPGAGFMSAYTCALVNEYPQINIVGEEWSTNPIITSRWQKGNVLSTDLNSCLPSVFDFPLQATLVQSLLQPENWNSGLNNLYELIACDGIYPDPFNLVVFPDNHDMDRFFTQINEDLDLFKIGMTYIATTRGIPQFYYGTEILMSNPKTHDHGEIRSDFPGGWTGDTKNAFSGLNLSVKEKEAQDFTRSLLNFRKNSTALHSGQLMHYAPQNGVYVYFRYNETQKIMVVLNKSDKAESFTPLKYPEMLQGGENGFNVLTNDKIDLKSLSLMPKSAHIIQINP